MAACCGLGVFTSGKGVFNSFININKMNSTVVIAVGIVLIIALIVWAFTVSARKEAAKKQKIIMGRLEALAKEHDSTIGPADNMGTKAIAMDNSKGKIFYVDHSNVVAQSEMIDIADVMSCEMIQTGNRQIEGYC